VYIGTIEGGNETPLEITYDPKYVGNPLSIGSKQLTWEGRRLKQIIDGDDVFNYTYNEQGLRTKKNINGVETKYYLQGTNIIAEEKNGQTMHFIYNEQNQLVGFEHQQNKYFYVRDLLGIIRNIIDVNGNVVVTYKYDAWGNHKVYDSSNAENTRSSFIGNINPFRYKGYYYDVESEWYYLQSRYYSPLLSRFINMDHTLYLEPGNVDGINLFAYCANNPVMYFDPSGNFPWLILAALLLFTPIGGTALQIATSTLSYAGMVITAIWDQDVRADMNAINWNPFNSNEQATLNSNNVSFYKGVPVFRTASGGRSGSFGAIFLTKSSGVDTLRHERGHNWQLMMMGVGTYGFTVGIPSPLKLGQWDRARNYYGAPWETMADLLGGVSGRSHSNKEIWYAWGYYAISTLAFPLTALYWF
jgi:RHS repeat-associated protein